MAQKQFKIGLSNTDKQNMAQDVYERLLALTFPEYDTTTEYEVGDFVVYNDQLYKCISATSGAWDSTKWQLATLNDLVDDIENAVAFVNDKANVNGNYPTMTVGMADNLTPYDESAGDDQDEPFILQATGTGNGTQPDFATGSGALMKEKQGNTVVVNNHFQYGTFASTTGWQDSNATLTVSNNVGSFTPTAQYGGIYSYTPYQVINGHKYLTIATIKGARDSISLNSNDGVSNNTVFISQFNSFQTIFKLWTAVNNNAITISVRDNGSSDFSEIQVKNVQLIDLTQWFNGDIPQDLLDNPSNFFRYYQGSLAYNEGELVNANGRYIKCIGMNQWDEETEVGGLIGGTLNSKNYIRVNPNTDYYLKSPYACGIVYYDKDQQEIRRGVASANSTFTTPSNCIYIKFYCSSDYGTTYNHNISINLYYEDEPRCLTYEPYQVLTNNDTGVEVLRSAGSVKDSKAPDGTITRRIGVVDLGTLTYFYQDSGSQLSPFFAANYSLIKRPTNIGFTIPNAICSKYLCVARNTSVMVDKTFSIDWNGETSQIQIKDSAYNDPATFKTAMSGVYLFYELAEPTTEQGTPYSENLVIDDFGSMDFGSDVPQGALIFYPVDYKAFVDTLYKYTDGTPSNIALKSDVASEQSARESVDTQLKNALGGTLRQCLCVKETLDFEDTNFVDLGTLNWTYTGANNIFVATPQNMFSPTTNEDRIKGILSTKYGISVSTSLSQEMTDKSMLRRSGNIYIRDTSYIDPTAFKNDMKGVLLAYEKGE